MVIVIVIAIIIIIIHILLLLHLMILIIWIHYSVIPSVVPLSEYDNLLVGPILLPKICFGQRMDVVIIRRASLGRLGSSLVFHRFLLPLVVYLVDSVVVGIGGGFLSFTKRFFPQQQFVVLLSFFCSPEEKEGRRGM